jgi:membrane associated rhomboid family serine protease
MIETENSPRSTPVQTSGKNEKVAPTLPEGLQLIPAHEYLDVVETYGKNPQSVLGGYPSYTQVRFKNRAVIAYQKYADTVFCVGAPVGSDVNSIVAVQELRALAKQKKFAKTVAFVAVLESEAKALEKLGFKKRMLGLDPFFDLPSWQPDYNRFHGAKRLIAEGAKVEVVEADRMTSDERREFNLIREEWLASRKIPPLAFLNQVDLWAAEHYKKYFRLRYRGRVVAVLAAVPAPAAKTWYLIDLLRGSRAENGTSELLFFKAMEHLKQQGAVAVNLGMAPLTGIDKDSKWFNFFYRKFRFFYNFKSLYDFKAKLQPTRWEATYLCAYPTFRVRNWVEFSQLIQPRSLPSVIAAWIMRSIKHFPVGRTVQQQLRRKLIVDDFPHTLGETFKHARLTQGIGITLIVLHAWVTFFTNWHGIDSPKNCFAYAYHAPFAQPCLPLLTSMFFHWNVFHLGFNLLLLAIFGTLAETIYGWRKVLTVFVCSAVGGQLCTTAVFAFLPHLNAVDLGASLGIFGMAGMVAWTFKKGVYLMAMLILGSMAASLVAQDLSQINHVFAVLIGYVTCHLLFQPKKGFT